MDLNFWPVVPGPALPLMPVATGVSGLTRRTFKIDMSSRVHFIFFRNCSRRDSAVGLHGSPIWSKGVQRLPSRPLQLGGAEFVLLVSEELFWRAAS